jgi:hypothetical protein
MRLEKEISYFYCLIQLTLEAEETECPENYETAQLYGARGSIMVKALCYKPEGRGFKTR